MYQDSNTRQKVVEECIGKTFGYLTVLKFIEYRQKPKGSIPYVLVRCQCGAEVEKSLWDIRQGKTKTCGSNRPGSPRHIKYKDRSIPAFRRIFRDSYKVRALKKGLNWEISESQFREISQMFCHYCGSPPSNKSCVKTMSDVGESRDSIFIYNGLDRLDSNCGYTLNNVVPCCGICNHAKHTMSYEVFVSWLDSIVAFKKMGSYETN